MVARKGEKRVRFAVVDTKNAAGLGFDPEAFSKAGNATCPFCGTVSDSDYVKAEGCAGNIGQQMMAIVCTRQGRQGKVYLAADEYPEFVTDGVTIAQRLGKLIQRSGISVPDEPIVTDAKNSCWTPLYGLTRFGQLFSPRQQLAMLSFSDGARKVLEQASQMAIGDDRRKAVGAAVSLVVSRLANFSSTLCTWFYDGGRGVKHVFARQALPMVSRQASLRRVQQVRASPGRIKHEVSDVVCVFDRIPGGGKLARGRSEVFVRVPHLGRVHSRLPTEPTELEPRSNRGHGEVVIAQQDRQSLRPV